MANYRYRRSDNGQIISKEQAEKLPREIWEKERVKPQPLKSPKNKSK